MSVSVVASKTHAILTLGVAYEELAIACRRNQHRCAMPRAGNCPGCLSVRVIASEAWITAVIAADILISV